MKMELNWQNFTSEGRIASLFPEAAIKVEVSVSAATDKIGLSEESERLSDTW